MRSGSAIHIAAMPLDRMVFLPGKVLKFLLMMSSAARSRRRADVNFRETMGAGFASLRNLFTRREARVLIMGLDAAGKTTILYKWKLCLLLELQHYLIDE